MKSSTLLLAGALLLGGAVFQPALAQAQNQERERREAWSIAFVEGLEALTRRDLEVSERLFKQCIRLYPERAVPYYNLACCYSLGGQVQPAVEALRAGFEKGYRDLAHMDRDMDLDPIRKTPAYRRAVSEFEEFLLADAKPPLDYEPEGSDPYPVLVFLPDAGASADALLSDLRAALSSWAVVVPQDAVQDPRGDDSSGEWRLSRAVDAWLDAHPRADRDRVTIAAEGAGGRVGLTAAAHRPDLFTAVVAAGPGLGGAVDGVDLDGARAYLVVREEDPQEVASGEEARDAFAEAGSPVVLERYPLATPLSRDKAVLLRALTWLGGEEITLPGAGEVRDF